MSSTGSRSLSYRMSAGALIVLSCGLSLVLTVRLCWELRGASGDPLAAVVGITWELAKWFFVAVAASMLTAPRIWTRLRGTLLACVSAVLIAGSVAASLAYLTELDRNLHGSALATSTAMEDLQGRIVSIDGEISTLAALADADTRNDYRRRALGTLSELRRLREARGDLAARLTELQADGGQADGLALFSGLVRLGRYVGVNSDTAALQVGAYGLLAVMLEVIGIAAIALFRGAHPGRASASSATSAGSRGTTRARAGTSPALEDMAPPAGARARPAGYNAEYNDVPASGCMHGGGYTSTGDGASVGYKDPRSLGRPDESMYPGYEDFASSGYKGPGSAGDERGDECEGVAREEKSGDGGPTEPVDGDEASCVEASTGGVGGAACVAPVRDRSQDDPGGPGTMYPADSPVARGGMAAPAPAPADVEASGAPGTIAPDGYEHPSGSERGAGSGYAGYTEPTKSMYPSELGPARPQSRAGAVESGVDGALGAREHDVTPVPTSSAGISPADLDVSRLKALIIDGRLRPTYRDLRCQLRVGQKTARRLLDDLVEEGVLKKDGRRYVEVH